MALNNEGSVLLRFLHDSSVYVRRLTYDGNLVPLTPEENETLGAITGNLPQALDDDGYLYETVRFLVGVYATRWQVGLTPTPTRLEPDIDTRIRLYTITPVLTPGAARLYALGYINSTFTEHLTYAAPSDQSYSYQPAIDTATATNYVYEGRLFAHGDHVYLDVSAGVGITSGCLYWNVSTFTGTDLYASPFHVNTGLSFVQGVNSTHSYAVVYDSATFSQVGYRRAAHGTAHGTDAQLDVRPMLGTHAHGIIGVTDDYVFINSFDTARGFSEWGLHRVDADLSADSFVTFPQFVGSDLVVGSAVVLEPPSWSYTPPTTTLDAATWSSPMPAEGLAAAADEPLLLDFDTGSNTSDKLRLRRFDLTSTSPQYWDGTQWGSDAPVDGLDYQTGLTTAIRLPAGWGADSTTYDLSVQWRDATTMTWAPWNISLRLTAMQPIPSAPTWESTTPTTADPTQSLTLTFASIDDPLKYGLRSRVSGTTEWRYWTGSGWRDTDLQDGLPATTIGRITIPAYWSQESGQSIEFQVRVTRALNMWSTWSTTRSVTSLAPAPAAPDWTQLSVSLLPWDAPRLSMRRSTDGIPVDRYRLRRVDTTAAVTTYWDGTEWQGTEPADGLPMPARGAFDNEGGDPDWWSSGTQSTFDFSLAVRRTAWHTWSSYSTVAARRVVSALPAHSPAEFSTNLSGHIYLDSLNYTLLVANNKDTGIVLIHEPLITFGARSWKASDLRLIRIRMREGTAGAWVYWNGTGWQDDEPAYSVQIHNTASGLVDTDMFAYELPNEWAPDPGTYQMQVAVLPRTWPVWSAYVDINDSVVVGPDVTSWVTISADQRSVSVHYTGGAATSTIDIQRHAINAVLFHPPGPQTTFPPRRRNVADSSRLVSGRYVTDNTAELLTLPFNYELITTGHPLDANGSAVWVDHTARAHVAYEYQVREVTAAGVVGNWSRSLV